MGTSFLQIKVVRVTPVFRAIAWSCACLAFLRVVEMRFVPILAK